MIPSLLCARQHIAKFISFMVSFIDAHYFSFNLEPNRRIERQSRRYRLRVLPLNESGNLFPTTFTNETLLTFARVSINNCLALPTTHLVHDSTGPARGQEQNGWRGWARTTDRTPIKRLLFQLSYPPADDGLCGSPASHACSCRRTPFVGFYFGGRGEIRTPDFLLAKQALSR